MMEYNIKVVIDVNTGMIYSRRVYRVILDKSINLQNNRFLNRKDLSVWENLEISSIFEVGRTEMELYIGYR